MSLRQPVPEERREGYYTESVVESPIIFEVATEYPCYPYFEKIRRCEAMYRCEENEE